MIDKVVCKVCGHTYVFKGEKPLDHYIWACEVLAEVERCVSWVISRDLIAIARRKGLKWSELEKDLLK